MLTDAPVRALLREYGITQAQLCRRFRIPRRTVQNWAAGTSACPPYLLALLRAELARDASVSAHAAHRLVAQFSDGTRALFDGRTEREAYERMSAAAAEHGDVAFFDGVTDEHYTAGVFCALVPDADAHLLHIDLTDQPDA